MLLSRIRATLERWRDRHRKPCFACADELKLYGDYIEHMIEVAGSASVISQEIRCHTCRRIIRPPQYDIDRVLNAKLAHSIEKSIAKALKPRRGTVMRAVEFEGQTCVLAPPEDWDNADDTKLKCGGLPVEFAEDRGAPVMRSFWSPSDQDIEALKNGAHICLSIVGTMHPPVMLHVEQCVEKP